MESVKQRKKYVRKPGATGQAEVWQGPSVINGQPIVVLATNLAPGLKSQNSKIGNMSQMWVLPAEEHPNNAIRNGHDESICGSCFFRKAMDAAGRRLCYVNEYVFNKIWASWKKGKHPVVAPADVNRVRPIRLGAYGDPAAVPFEMWAEMLGLEEA